MSDCIKDFLGMRVPGFYVNLILQPNSKWALPTLFKEEPKNIFFRVRFLILFLIVNRIGGVCNVRLHKRLSRNACSRFFWNPAGVSQPFSRPVSAEHGIFQTHPKGRKPRKGSLKWPTRNPRSWRSPLPSSPSSPVARRTLGSSPTARPAITSATAAR